MLNDAANVIQREFTQTSIAVAGEQVLTIFPYRLVHVHAGTIIADDRFWHEGSCLAIGMSGIQYNVLEDLSPVGALRQAGEFGADFTLTGSRYFMVMHFDRHTHAFECNTHGGADVLQ